MVSPLIKVTWYAVKWGETCTWTVEGSLPYSLDSSQRSPASPDRPLRLAPPAPPPPPAGGGAGWGDASRARDLSLTHSHSVLTVGRGARHVRGPASDSEPACSVV